MSVKTALLSANSAVELTSATEIFDKLCSVFAEQFELGAESMRLEASLVTDFDLDSLDFAALGTEIEGSIGVVLTENDLSECETFSDLVNRVAARKSELDG